MLFSSTCNPRLAQYKQEGQMSKAKLCYKVSSSLNWAICDTHLKIYMLRKTSCVLTVVVVFS